MQSQSREWSASFGVALVVAAGVIWSFGVIFVPGADGLDAWQYLGWRSAGLIVALGVWTAIRRKSLVAATIRQGGLGWIASVGLVFSSLMIIVALKSTTIANAIFLASIAPVISVAASAIIFKERPGIVTVACTFMAMVGVAIMVNGDFGGGSMAGNAAALLSACGFAVYSLCLRIDPARDWTSALWAHAWICLTLSIAATVALGSALFIVSESLLPIAHGGLIICTGLILFNRASSVVSAVTLTVIAQTETILAPVWGWAILDERLPPATIVGGMVIIVAVVGAALAFVHKSKNLSVVTAP